jgi:DNA-binding transcriptional LysR family regulator
MQPSPYALTLFDELRPLLRGIGRALAPPQDFAPATSERVFRVAIYAAPPLVAGIIARVRAEAPGVTLDWVAMNARLLTAVADGLVDVALVGGEMRLPDGIVSRTVEPTAWFTFARRDHPAVADWGPEAWARWPHLQVRVDNTTSSPVEGRRGQNGLARRIGARISEFAAVAPVLAATDYLGTFPVLLLAEDLDRFGLAALEPVVRPAPFRMRFVWSARLDQDPGNRWLRGLVQAAYAASQVAALARVRAAGLVEARRA